MGEWNQAGEGICRLDTRKKFFVRRAVKHWNVMLREALNFLSLTVFKAKLDGTLNKLV